jgi:hypothetical protein
MTLKLIDASIVVGAATQRRPAVSQSAATPVANEEPSNVGQGKGDFERWRDGWLRAVLSDRAAGSSSKAVAAAISLRLNRKTRNAWPSVRNLDKESGLSKSTVLAALRELEGLGYLKVNRRWKKHSRERESNVYIPTIPGRQAGGTRGSNSDTPRTNSLGTPCPTRVGQNL